MKSAASESPQDLALGASLPQVLASMPPGPQIGAATGGAPLPAEDAKLTDRLTDRESAVPRAFRVPRLSPVLLKLIVRRSFPVNERGRTSRHGGDMTGSCGWA